MISIPVALLMIGRTRQCRVPTQNNIVGKRHCRILISAHNNSDGIEFDMTTAN